MAYLIMVVNLPNSSIGDINSECQFPTKVEESLQGAIQVLNDIQAGCKAATVQLTSRDSTVAVSTSGSGSQQATYNHL